MKVENKMLVWSLINAMFLGIYVVLFILEEEIFLSIPSSIISVITFFSITLSLYFKHFNYSNKV